MERTISHIKIESEVAGAFHIIVTRAVQRFSVILDIGGCSLKNGLSSSRNIYKIEC